MTAFFLGMLGDILTGSAKQRIDAAEAFETPPRNRYARGYATAALLLFLTASAMFLSAALVDCFAGARFAAECFGGAGLVCLQLCVVCGIRYAVVNGNPYPTTEVPADMPANGCRTD